MTFWRLAGLSVVQLRNWKTQISSLKWFLFHFCTIAIHFYEYDFSWRIFLMKAWKWVCVCSLTLCRNFCPWLSLTFISHVTLAVASFSLHLWSGWWTAWMAQSVDIISSVWKSSMCTVCFACFPFNHFSFKHQRRRRMFWKYQWNGGVRFMTWLLTETGSNKILAIERDF